MLPFIVLGPLPLLILIPILLLMPRRPALSDATQRRRPTIHGGAWVRMRRLLTPGLVVSAFLAMVPFLSWATLDLGLTVWLTGPPHDLSVVGATGIFTLIPAGYFFGSLGFGWATDKVQEKKLLIAVGLWATGAMYVLFCPGWYRLVVPH